MYRKYKVYRVFTQLQIRNDFIMNMEDLASILIYTYLI